MNVILLVALLTSMLTAWLLMRLLLHVCHHRGIYDAEAYRQNKINRIPRLGGVVFVPALIAGLTVTMLLRLSEHSVDDTVHLSTLLIGCGGMAIYMTGMADDIFGISHRLKWLIKASACATLPLCALYINNLYGFFGMYEVTGFACYPITFVVALIIVEAVNSLDDTDGLAGCLSLLTLTILSYNFYILGYYTYAFFGFCLGAAVLVYLCYNIWGDPRIGTKIYMGNSGSLIIGFGLTYLCIKYVMDNKQVMDERPDGLLIPFSTLFVPAFDYVYVFLKSLFVTPPEGKAKHFRVQHLLRSCGLSERATTAWLLSAAIFVFCLNMGIDKWLDGSVNVILAVDLALYTIGRYALSRQVMRGEAVPVEHSAPKAEAGQPAFVAAGNYEYEEGLVSVIMPTWNSAQFVAESIESILRQTYPHLELIITDDASTDGTPDILREYCRDPRVRIILNTTNGGAGRSRNCSIEAARGQYIAFCDSDDRWAPNKLELQLKFMREQEVAMCFCPYYTCGENDEYLGYVSAPRRVSLFQMMCDNKIGFLTAIYDASLLGRHLMPSQRKRQDHALLLQLLKICHHAYSIDKPLAHYRLHSNNISGNKFGLLRYNAQTYNSVFGWPKVLCYAFLFTFFLPSYFHKRIKNICITILRSIH